MNTQKVEAVYENGSLKLSRPLQGIAEHAHVVVTVETEEVEHHPLGDCVGSLPTEDAEDMQRIIEEEFEKVNADEWR